MSTVFFAAGRGSLSSDCISKNIRNQILYNGSGSNEQKDDDDDDDVPGFRF
jgi:hypothetical protein